MEQWGHQERVKMASLTQRVHWGRLSAALEGWVSSCSTFPSQTPLAWRPLPASRSQSCHGRSRQSLDTQWSSCSGQFDLTERRSHLMTKRWFFKPGSF